MTRYPTKYPKSKAKWDRLRPYISCFFDVPYKTVQEILGVTHHTLDPLRRELGFDRWPYPDVKSDNFCMTSDEIRTKRQEMMLVADDRMREILVNMQEEACKARTNWRKPRTRRRGNRSEETEAQSVATHPNETYTQSLEQLQNGISSSSLVVNDESRAFWDEISHLLFNTPPSPSMPRHAHRADCVNESILLPTGEVENILLDERYAPYSKQTARIENLCGSFTEFVPTCELDSVATRNGTQREMYHIHGNVVINQGKAAFMAARGMACLDRLALSLGLAAPSNVVHMAVITSRMGKRAQVTNAGLLEATLARRGDELRIDGRMYEQTNSVRFSVRSFVNHPFTLPPEMIPDKNDWTVTGKGMVITRLIWKRLVWSADTEACCLRFCNSTTEWLQNCC